MREERASSSTARGDAVVRGVAVLCTVCGSDATPSYASKSGEGDLCFFAGRLTNAGSFDT